MNKKILIAEDEKPMAKALELKLGHSGFDVRTVFDGEEALEILGQEKFDLIFIDLIMPKLDGFHVLEELQKKNNSVPIAVLSNLGQEEDIRRAKELGAKDYFVKSDTPIANIVDYTKKILGV